MSIAIVVHTSLAQSTQQNMQPFPIALGASSQRGQTKGFRDRIKSINFAKTKSYNIDILLIIEIKTAIINIILNKVNILGLLGSILLSFPLLPLLRPFCQSTSLTICFTNVHLPKNPYLCTRYAYRNFEKQNPSGAGY